MIQKNQSQPLFSRNKTISPAILTGIKNHYNKPTKISKSDCIILGWGYNKKSQSYDTILNQANLRIISQDMCQRKFWTQHKILPTTFCAHSTSAAACNGDSGGPILCRNVHAKSASQGHSHHPENYFLTGIITWGDQNCGYDLPAVFTNVSQYLPWIEKTIRDNSGVDGLKKLRKIYEAAPSDKNHKKMAFANRCARVVAWQKFH